MNDFKHVLLVGGMRPMHDEIRTNDGVKSTLIINASKIKARDANDNIRVLGVSNDDISEWILLAQTVHKFDAFTSVGAFHDFFQDKAACIAEALSLNFHSPEVVNLVSNKYLMRQKLRENGVDMTPSMLISSSEQIYEFASLYNYPLILKPTDNFASTGISYIQEAEAVRKAIENSKVDSDTEIVVEKYLEGEEYSVEIFSEDGIHEIICITKKFKDKESFVEIGHILPAQLSSSVEKLIREFVIQVLDSLHIAQGCSHMEIILTDEGPRIVETHVRPAGDYIPMLVTEALGIDVFQYLGRQTLGEKVLDSLRQKLQSCQEERKFGAIWFDTPRAEGEIVEITGLEDAREIEEVIKVELLKQKGDKLDKVISSFHRAAYAMCISSTQEKALDGAKRALNKLRFNVEATSNINLTTE